MKHFVFFFTIGLLLPCCSDSSTTSGFTESSQHNGSDTVEIGPDTVASSALDDTVEEVDVPRADLSFENVEIVSNPNNVLSAIVTLETSESARVEMTFKSENTQLTTTAKSPEGTLHKITVLGMRADTEYILQPVAHTSTGGQRSGEEYPFKTGTVPGELPPIEVVVHDAQSVQPGVTVFGVSMGMSKGSDPSKGPQYLGVDEAGHIVWYYWDEKVGANNDRLLTRLEDGNFLISLPGEFRIISPGGSTLRRFKGGSALGGSLHHDAIELPSGTLVALSNEKRTVTVPSLGGEVTIKGDRLLELDINGSIVWSWNAFDHLDTTRFPGHLSQKKNKKDNSYDWTHANAVVYIAADDSLLISFRHQNWVTKIDHDTGKVLWSLGEEGDFELLKGDWFYSEHAPEWRDDGRLLLYDNGNERPGSPKFSRAVIYQLDESNMTVTQLWEYKTESYTSFLGGARWLDNGNVLVCAGGNQIVGGMPGQASPGTARITEVTEENTAQKVWELSVVGGYIYRATRLTSL